MELTRTFLSDDMAVNQENFDKFMKEIKLSLTNRKYRKVLDDIQSKQNIFILIKEKWRLSELKIRAIIKIIYRKNIKYEGNLTKLKSIEKWLSIIESEFDFWFESIIDNENDDEQIEILIQLLIEHYYVSAITARNEKKISECVGLLGLSEKIVTEFIDICRDPRTLNIAQKTYLFLSSLLIVDSDYNSAKNYQSLALRLSFKELFYRVEIEDSVNIINLDKVEQHYMIKLFTNIVLEFYQRGICEENIGNYTKAAEAYKQARWFSGRFLKNHLPDFNKFIQDLCEKCFCYTRVFLKTDGAKSEENNSDSECNREKVKNKLKGIRNMSSSDLDIEFQKSQLIEFIKSLKFPEFECNRKDDNIKEIMYTVKILDNLLSDKFKGVIKNLDSLNIHKMDKKSIELIQNKINSLRSEEIYYKNKKIHKELLQSELKFRRRSASVARLNFSFFEIKSDEELSKNSRDITRMQKYSISSKINNESYFSKKMKKSNSQIDIKDKSKFSNFSQRKYDEIENIKYDEFTFSEKFRKKLEFLTKAQNREILFQKQILNLKKFEKNSIPQYNIDNISELHKSNLISKVKNRCIIFGEEKKNKFKSLRNNKIRKRKK